MTKIFAVLIFSGEFLTSLLLLFSLLQPEHRIWPPKSEQAWGRYLTLFLFNTIAALIIALGILDWGGNSIPVWLQILGGLLWSGGMGLAVWGMLCLGKGNTTGIPACLIERGPYRWTRNPQYLGFILGLIGWGLLSSSTFTLAACAGAIIPVILAPRVEEPWLLEIYGREYAEYLKRVPRFLLIL